LDLKSKGLPTDVNQILRAEAVCDEALALLRKRDHRGAVKQLREAIQLNPGQAIYFAYLGWAVFLSDPASTGAVTEAVQALKKAMTMQENLPLAYQYLGQIAVQRDAFEEAKKWFSRCLEWEPGNIEAQRGLRLVSSRKEDKASQKSSGLLSRFLSKKN
jgi:tetratricopeptide (TPR) repeat protein